MKTLAAEVNINAKSLHRMLGPKGNPQAKMLFPVLAHLQRRENVRLHMASAA